MSDTSGCESGGLPKKKSFSSRITKKLHNPFKRSNSSSSSDDDESTKSPGSVKSRKSKPSFMPSMPIKFSSSSPSSPDSSGPANRGVTRGEAEHAVGPPPPIPPRRSAAVASPVAAGASAATAPAAPAVSPARATRAPAGTTDTLPSQSAMKPAANATAAAAASAATSAATAAAATAAGGQGSGNVPAGGAAAAAAPMPPPPRTVAGGPVYGAPSIVMMGVKGDSDAAMLNLRTRGFVVHLAMLHEDVVPPTMTMVLGLGPKLMVKSAVEQNLPARARGDYTSGEVSQLCADAVHVIMRSGVLYAEMTLLHDKAALEGVANAGYKEAPAAVNSYFGPYVGMYFEWLGFYTKALVVPTIGGLFLFLDQWRAGSPDSLLLPIYCVLIMVWTALFLDLWRRRNSSIAFRWGVDGVEDRELMRIAALKEGEFAPSPAGKLCMTVPIILAAIYVVIRVMLYCIWLSDHAAEVYGAESYMQYYPLLLYSGVPIVASFAYDFLARALNEFEDHPTAVRKKNALIIKMFAFQFVNSYCALLYVGFWLRDINRLRQLVMMMMMVKQFVAQIVEMYQPVLMRWLKDRKEKKNPPKDPTFLVKHTGTIGAEELLEEMKADPADVESEYLEMVLQFGYISMFFVVFPLAPFFAILNNVWEFKLDLSKLVKTRRPQTHEEASIGAWQLCLEMIGVVACLSNLLLAVMVSQNVSSYVPASMTERLGSIEGKVVVVVVAEHVLFLLRAIFSGLVDKVPRAVREAQAIIAVQQKQERREFRRLASGLPASEKSAKSFGSLLAGATPRGRLQQLAKTHDVWNFGPMWHLPLAVIPFLVAWLELSALWVLPTAFVFVSYLQHRKDSSDKALALGIVKDPQVLKLVTKFLPPWYTDSEVERVDWMNKTLEKMWVSASSATEDLFDTTIQPILDSYRPPGISALGFRKVSLGTIPPKIVGVRALETKDDTVVLDIDIRWAGNAEFVVEAGVKPVPLLITLNKICFSGRMRVELTPLVPVFPCFGAVVLTFMEKPFINFQFSLGKLEVMSIGPGDMNVGNVVSDLIKNIITDLMVFPAKLPVPILDGQDLIALQNPVPTGVLQLTLVGCDNLRAADIGGKSDPYVKMKLGREQVMKTDTKKRTLKPRYDETFDLLVYERSVEVLLLSVYDRDAGPGDDDFLGGCELPLSVLQADVESSHNIPLSKTTSGSLLLKATFVPLASGAKRMEQPDEDVIVDAGGDEVTDDTVAGDVYQNLSADGQPIKPPMAARAARGPSVDPSTLKPATVLNLSDTSMGVVSVMGIECKGVKPGDRYVSVICGNTKRKTAVTENMANFACTEVFHFLVKGAKSAVVEILLKEKESIGNDKCLGSFKVNVAEVMANFDQLDGEWDLTGEKAKGAIKMRLQWSGRAGDDGTS